MTDETLLDALANLRAAYQIHQDGHWQVDGSSSYGQHLLLQRLYEETQDLADGFAERLVGMGLRIDEPDMAERIRSTVDVVSETDGCVHRSLSAVNYAIDGHAAAYDALKRAGTLTLGTDDLLMAQSNTLETHRYLLQQALKPARGLKARLLR